MNIELSIIKLLLTKENYDKFGSVIYGIETEPEIKKILLTVAKYFEKYPHHIYIAVDELQTYFHTEFPSDKKNELYATLFKNLRGLEVSDSLGADIVRQYIERDTANTILQQLLPVINGEASNAVLQVPELIETYKERALLVDEEDSPWVEDTLDELLDLIDKRGGLRWSLDHLNQNIGPLPGCTLGHLFARVEAGKTSFIASQVAHWLPQLEDNAELIWVSNEENGRFIRLRCHQAVLNMSNEEIREALVAGRNDELAMLFDEAGGNRVRIHHDPNATVETVRSLVERSENPRVLVIDIADHLRFRGDGELATHQRLGELYRKYRGLAAHNKLDILTVGQASAEAEGRKTLHLDHMHQSKTDKPGALDYAIGIGRSYDPAYEEVRWTCIPKNKIGATVQETEACTFDKLRGRFEDA